MAIIDNNNSNFRPMDWDSLRIPSSGISGGSITAAPIKYDYNLSGELLDYTMRYDLDWILASGMSEEDLNIHIKKELATKLAAKMIEDGHFSFTKQVDHADNSVCYKAYTWVGNKDFIEQQRKNKR